MENILKKFLNSEDPNSFNSYFTPKKDYQSQARGLIKDMPQVSKKSFIK
jgi:hypothetical protein